MRYYEIFQWGALTEVHETGWTLAICDTFADGTPVDIWAYSSGERIANPSPVSFRIYALGRILDFNRLAFRTIVVSRKMADAIDSISSIDIQRIPAIIDADGDWEVLNLLTTIDCIDHKESLIQYFPGDHPDYPGKPRTVFSLRLDVNRIDARHHIFRPADWIGSTIVSQTLLNRLYRSGVIGIEYRSVTV